MEIIQLILPILDNDIDFMYIIIHLKKMEPNG